MVSKKYLSQKKNTRQSISLSAELKERIENYVRTNQKRFPEDKRFKSISAFYNYIMEKTLEIYEKGKSLEDFDKIDDIEMVGALFQFNIRAPIPLHENALKTNRYTDLNYKILTSYFFVIRNFLLTTLDPKHIPDIRKFSERFRNYLISNKTTKDLKYKIIPGKDPKFPSLIFEVFGIYKNISHEFFKFHAGVVGFCGIKLVNFIYKEKEHYGKFEYIPTELFYNQKLMRQERLKLMKENLSFVVNYNHLLKDKDYYLWMKLADMENFLLNYDNENTIRKQLDLVKLDLMKFGGRDELLLKIIQFFERIHWIKIEDEDDLTFHILLTKKEFPQEFEFLIKYLSEQSNLSQKGELYTLTNK